MRLVFRLSVLKLRYNEVQENTRHVYIIFEFILLLKIFFLTVYSFNRIISQPIPRNRITLEYLKIVYSISNFRDQISLTKLFYLSYFSTREQYIFGISLSKERTDSHSSMYTYRFPTAQKLTRKKGKSINIQNHGKK